MINYYDRFIKNLSSILVPLHGTLQKGIVFKWTDDCVLAHFDPKFPLILQ